VDSLKPEKINYGMYITLKMIGDFLNFLLNLKLPVINARNRIAPETNNNIDSLFCKERSLIVNV